MFLAVAVFACMLAIVFYLSHLGSSIRDMYAVWWVGDMIVLHLEKTEDHWPRCWDDLKDDYDTCVARAGQPWTFQELRDRVEIDWKANVDDLRAVPPDSSGDVPFRVVRLRSGRKGYWAGREPNRMIHRYLQKLPPDP